MQVPDQKCRKVKKCVRTPHTKCSPVKRMECGMRKFLDPKKVRIYNQRRLDIQHIYKVKQQRCIAFPPSPVDEECSSTPGHSFLHPIPELPNQPFLHPPIHQHPTHPHNQPFLPPYMHRTPTQPPTHPFLPPQIHQHPSQDYENNYYEAEGMTMAEPEGIPYLPYEPHPDEYDNAIIPSSFHDSTSPPFYPSAREELFLPSHADTNGLQV